MFSFTYWLLSVFYLPKCSQNSRVASKLGRLFLKIRDDAIIYINKKCIREEFIMSFGDIVMAFEMFGDVRWGLDPLDSLSQN